MCQGVAEIGWHSSSSSVTLTASVLIWLFVICHIDTELGQTSSTELHGLVS